MLTINKNEYKMKVEFYLNPDREDDESRVSIMLSEDGSATFRLYDCADEYTTHRFSKGERGRNKLLLLQTAINIMLHNNLSNDE